MVTDNDVLSEPLVSGNGMCADLVFPYVGQIKIALHVLGDSVISAAPPKPRDDRRHRFFSKFTLVNANREPPKTQNAKRKT